MHHARTRVISHVAVRQHLEGVSRVVTGKVGEQRLVPGTNLHTGDGGWGTEAVTNNSPSSTGKGAKSENGGRVWRQLEQGRYTGSQKEQQIKGKVGRTERQPEKKRLGARMARMTHRQTTCSLYNDHTPCGTYCKDTSCNKHAPLPTMLVARQQAQQSTRHLFPLARPVRTPKACGWCVRLHRLGDKRVADVSVWLRHFQPTGGQKCDSQTPHSQPTQYVTQSVHITCGSVV